MGGTGMVSEIEGRGRKLLRVDTVHGEPIEVRGRTFIPEARVVSFGKGSATIASRRLRGWGTGFAHVTPVAFVEQDAHGERRIAIRDRTAVAVRDLVALTAVLTLLLAVIRWAARRLHCADGQP
jgi:uncharacterized spore protein YtfJ